MWLCYRTSVTNEWVLWTGKCAYNSEGKEPEVASNHNDNNSDSNNLLAAGQATILVSIPITSSKSTNIKNTNTDSKMPNQIPQTTTTMKKHNPESTAAYKVTDRVIITIGCAKVEATILAAGWDHNGYCWCYQLGRPANKTTWYDEEYICSIPRRQDCDSEEKTEKGQE